MNIIPKNVDPSKDYVDPGYLPPLTVNGLVYNGVYAHTGVIDALTQTNKTGYSDPNFNIINSINKSIAFQQQTDTNWISSTDFGGPNSAPVILTYNLSVTTYYNNISFDVLNVPCFVEIGYYSFDINTGLYDIWSALPGTSTFIIAGGSDIYTTTDWLHQEYNAPSTLSGINNLVLRITRNQPVQSQSSSSGPTQIAYSIGIQNFSIKLQIQQESDIPLSVLSGTSAITTQNRFGFAESYTFKNNPVANAFSGINSGLYWKCAPQPVQDSIVFFYAQVSNTTPTTINRIFINPLYSGCKFNIYYTTNTISGSVTDPGQFTWTPIQRDFTLRKGIYEIPTTMCTYLKFEFTRLVAEAYDLPFDTVTKTINAFPYEVEQYYQEIESNIINSNSILYSSLGSSSSSVQSISSAPLNNSTIFGSANNAVANVNSWPNLSALNASQVGNTTTVAMNTPSTIVDPSSSYKTIGVNGQYNNQTNTEFLQRRFPNVSQHEYTSVIIEQSWHQVYFAGVQYVTAFMENNFDDLRTLPGNFISANGTTSGFATFPAYSGSNPATTAVDYVGLNPDMIALTPWFSTIDTFKSFNIGGLTTDWKSFLTDNQVLLNDTTNLITNNAFITPVSNLGSSTIISVAGVSGTSYGVKTGSYYSISNFIGYNDANFVPVSGTALSWSGMGGTTITGTSVTAVISGVLLGTFSGMSVSGGGYTASYNFTIPGVYSPSGTQSWTLQFGTPSFGTVGYASYIPVSGTSFGAVNYYFLVNAQTPGNASGVPTSSTTLTSYTQFVDPNNGYSAINGTTVSGSITTVTSGIGSNIVAITGTNYTTSGMPSNTIKFVVSGTAGTPYNLYQLGAFNAPTSVWVGPQDRKNMRVSGVARILLPISNNGSYRASLYAIDPNGNLIEVAHKVFLPGTIPLNTWVDIEVQSFSGLNYSNFSMQIQQTNSSVNEIFYVSMLSPFYHPVRYEYITTSGSTNWQQITTGINDHNTYISTISGLPASGVQVRLTALDPNVYISGLSIIPRYKQSPYYADLRIDYLGTSKTNELSIRRDIASKPYFLLNKYPYPSRFQLSNVAGTVTNYFIS